MVFARWKNRTTACLIRATRSDCAISLLRLRGFLGFSEKSRSQPGAAILSDSRCQVPKASQPITYFCVSRGHLKLLGRSFQNRFKRATTVHAPKGLGRGQVTERILKCCRSVISQKEANRKLLFEFCYYGQLKLPTETVRVSLWRIRQWGIFRSLPPQTLWAELALNWPL